MVYIISVLSIVRAPSLHFLTTCSHIHKHTHTDTQYLLMKMIVKYKKGWKSN